MIGTIFNKFKGKEEGEGSAADVCSPTQSRAGLGCVDCPMSGNDSSKSWRNRD